MIEQFGSASALERANLHNSLSVWRENMQHQMQAQMSMKQYFEAEATENKEMYTKLHDSFSYLTLRYGLLVTEKKTSDEEIASVRLREKELFGKYAKIKNDFEAQTRKMADLGEKATEQKAIHAQTLKINTDLQKDRDEQLRKVGDLTEQVIQLKVNNGGLRIKDDEHQKELQQWSDSLQEKEEELARCKSTREEQRREFADQLKQREAEAQQQLFHLQAKLHDAEKGVKDKIVDVKNKNITIEELRERLQVLQNHHLKNDQIVQRLNTPTIDDADRLNKKLEEQQVTIKKLQEMEPTIRKLQQESLSLSTANRIMKSDLAAVELREKDLRSDKDATQERLKAAESSIEAMKLGLTDLDRRRSQLASELDTANKAKGEIAVMCSARAVQLDAAGEMIAELKTKLQLEKPVELEEAVHKLNEERKKSRALAAENTQLAFQVASHRGTFEAERKGLWAQIKEHKQEIERLNQDTFRLASKLTTTTAKENTNPFATPSRQDVAALKLKTEQPDNFIFRNAAFDYDVVPNPDSPVTVENTKRDYIARLEDQMRCYRKLLKEGKEFKDDAEICAKTARMGLHKDSPKKSYVNPQYYDEVMRAQSEVRGNGDDAGRLSRRSSRAPHKPLEEEGEVVMIMDDEILF